MKSCYNCQCKDICIFFKHHTEEITLAPAPDPDEWMEKLVILLASECPWYIY